MTAPPTEPAPPPRVAVIAVHGVADQRPGESARAVAALLHELAAADGDTGPADRAPLEYSPFEARTLHVPLRPVPVHDPASALVTTVAIARAEGGSLAGLRSAFSERRGFFARMRRAPDPRAADDPGTLAHEFMRVQLAGYTGPPDGASYVTTRLEGSGKRRGAPRDGSGATTVHVYELFWADISRFGGGTLAFLGALYQLLFHLCTLGRQAVDDAAIEHGNRGAWRLLANLQAYAVRTLILPIPILNLTLLVAAFAPLPARRIPDRAAVAVATAAGALFGLTTVYAVARRWIATRPAAWMAVPAYGALVGAVTAWAATRVAPAGVVLAAEWWLLAGTGVSLLIKGYARVRPGARLVGDVAYAAALVAFAAFAVAAWRRFGGADATRVVEYASLWTMQLLFGALRLSWIVVVVLAIAAFALGAALTRAGRIPDLARRARARAAVRTGRLAIALTVSLFLTVTIIIWSGLFALSARRLDVFEGRVVEMAPGLGAWSSDLVPTPASLSAWLGPVTRDNPTGPYFPAQGLQVYDYVHGLLVTSVGSGLPLMLLLLASAFGLLLWMALPSVSLEGRDSAPSGCTNRESRRAGAWLSRGLDSTAAVTYLLWATSFLVPFLAGLVDRWAAALPGFLLSASLAGRAVSVELVSAAGAAVAASAAVLFAILGKAGGSALDVVLDVDNYLRTMPLERTPRARIAERYASLLRTVAAERDERGRPYDAVIVVAHSLGALITGDLLRFLRREARTGGGDPALAALGYGPTGDPARDAAPRIPIHLFTMGNPVRQLLCRFFPHRYRWVRDEPDNGARSLDRLAPTRAIPAGATPDPAALGVASWRNAYRSGDYVGRSLWLDEWYGRTTGADDEGGYPEPIHVARRELASEMCIGLGAHTHYWDRTAPDVAHAIDALVREAAAAAPRPPDGAGA